MSAEVLREAATKMRERAEAAVLATDEQPWVVHLGGGHLDCYAGLYGVQNTVGTQVAHHSTEEQADHIASWHPAVALAVADWLDAEAEGMVVADGITCFLGADRVRLAQSTFGQAEAVARAYIGRDS